MFLPIRPLMLAGAVIEKTALTAPLDAKLAVEATWFCFGHDVQGFFVCFGSWLSSTATQELLVQRLVQRLNPTYGPTTSRHR